MTSPPTPSAVAPGGNPQERTASKDSRIGKGYSYLFASILTALLVGQSTDISFKTNRAGEYEWAVATRELNAQIFYPCVGLIAAILGLPTDTIALALGHFLSKERE